jgi:hypothetical protein
MWILGEQQQLALMGFGHRVTFETVLVSALLLTHLTVPSQLLKALRLHFVGDVLRCSNFVLTHDAGLSSSDAR